MLLYVFFRQKSFIWIKKGQSSVYSWSTCESKVSLKKLLIICLILYSNYTYQITIDIIKCNTYFREKIACSVCNIQAEMLSSMENVENELANKNGKCISVSIFFHYALQL